MWLKYANLRMKSSSLGLSNVQASNFTMHSPHNIPLYIMHILTSFMLNQRIVKVVPHFMFMGVTIHNTYQRGG